MLKVSEVVADLTGHQLDGHVVVCEIDSMNTFLIESVLKEAGKLPVLKVRPVRRNPYGRFPETLFQQAFASKHNSYQGTVGKSPVDGKYRVTVDGKLVLEQGFETDAEARIFLCGFVMGFTSGAAEAK